MATAAAFDPPRGMMPVAARDQRSRLPNEAAVRTASSAAHASNLLTDAAGVRFTRGADRVTTYKLPEARFFSQVFCPSCGSQMPRVDPDRNLAIIRWAGSTTIQA